MTVGRPPLALWSGLIALIVVHKDMQVGFLADDTDHGTRELREIFKGISSLSMD